MSKNLKPSMSSPGKYSFFYADKSREHCNLSFAFVMYANSTFDYNTNVYHVLVMIVMMLTITPAAEKQPTFELLNRTLNEWKECSRSVDMNVGHRIPQDTSKYILRKHKKTIIMQKRSFVPLLLVVR